MPVLDTQEKIPTEMWGLFPALQESRKQEDVSLFITFMTEQYKKFLQTEMHQFRKDISNEPSKKNNRIDGKGFSLLY